jgi:plastocyanin
VGSSQILKSRFSISFSHVVIFLSGSAQAPPRSLSGMGPVLIAFLIIVAGALGYVQISYAPGHFPHPISSSSSSSNTVSTTPFNVTVTIVNGSHNFDAPQTYVPDVITVVVGYNSTVIWMNNDSQVHTVTANASSPDPAFNSFGPPSPSSAYNNVQPGSTVTFTFTRPGTYGYYCSYHSWMVGKVIVVSAPSSSTNTLSSSSTSILGGLAYSSALLARATDLASNLETLIGSGTAPWRVNLSSNLFASIFEIPAVLTKTL